MAYGLQNYGLGNLNSADLTGLLGNNNLSSSYSNLGKRGSRFGSSGSGNGGIAGVTGQGTGLFDSIGGLQGLQGLASLGLGGLEAYTGLQSIGLGKKALGLAKQQFAFEKGMANRNLANQATTINNAYDASAQIAAGMLGSRTTDSNTGLARYGNTSQDIVDRYAASAKEKHVDGTPIA